MNLCLYALLHAGCFYFVLGNIHPKYRSTLRSIQLVALAKVMHIKEYGLHSILQVIVDDICKLEKVQFSYIENTV